MALKSDYNASQTEQELKNAVEAIGHKIVEYMHYAGETFIINARQQPGDHAQGFYKDDTGALRKSVQYLIFHDGELIESSESENSIANRSEVQELIKPGCFQLIGIAGMNYASIVESKGFNVITNQQMICFDELDGYMKRLELEKDLNMTGSSQEIRPKK